MFAYCLNNPANGFDSSGTRFQNPNYRYYDGFAEYTDTGTGSWVFSEDGNFIEDQCNFSAAAFLFGGETVSECGCGVVASYNVLISRGINVGFYDVYKYACSIHKTPGGLNQDEIISIIMHFDPSVSKSTDGSTSVLVFYGYYSYKVTGPNTIELVKREGGHVEAGFFTGAGTVHMYNAVGGNNFEANLNDYLSYFDYYMYPSTLIIGIVEYKIHLR